MNWTPTAERMPATDHQVILALSNGEYCRGYRQIMPIEKTEESFVNCSYVNGMIPPEKIYLPADKVVAWTELYSAPKTWRHEPPAEAKP